MIRGAPADDLHAKNIPIEFRRRSRVCAMQSNVVDTGVTTGSQCHFALCCGFHFNVSHFGSPFIVGSFRRSLRTHSFLRLDLTLSETKHGFPWLIPEMFVKKFSAVAMNVE